jgi:FKBP-type peptidyl-prolyl cis-trans isomerase
MRNQVIVIALFFSLFANSLCAEEEYDSFLDQEIEQLSFYMGYLLGRDHAKNSYGFPTKFEKIVEGMKAGIAGDPIPEKEELTPLIKRMQKTVVERQTILNLQEAENYLKNLSNKQDLVEVEPSKLFYRVEKQGDGQPIKDLPWLHFKMSELKNGEARTIYVHPDLAFGMGKLDVAPNRLIVFEVMACKE